MLKIYILYNLDDEYGCRDYIAAYHTLEGLKKDFEIMYPDETLYSEGEQITDGYIWRVDWLGE